MALTEEQKERIRKNREKALEIQRKRREENKKESEVNKSGNEDILNPPKKQKTTDSSPRIMSKRILDRNKVEEDHHHYSIARLEDFEEGASEWISKREAMTMYCLPEGSMAVCFYEEKKNPRNPLFKPMKLYRRSEIRYRAHKRYGGLEGLVKERDKRQKRKMEKDMEEAGKIFK